MCCWYRAKLSLRPSNNYYNKSYGTFQYFPFENSQNISRKKCSIWHGSCSWCYNLIEFRIVCCYSSGFIWCLLRQAGEFSTEMLRDTAPVFLRSQRIQWYLPFCCIMWYYFLFIILKACYRSLHLVSLFLMSTQPDMKISTTTRYINPNHILLSPEDDYKMV